MRRATISVLYVDDEADIGVIVKMALELKPSFRVQTVESGREALRELETERQIDIILVDVMMPEMSGPELLAAIREMPARAATPVVFITAKARESDVDSYLRLGAAGVITKPFDPLALADKIFEFIQL